MDKNVFPLEDSVLKENIMTARILIIDNDHLMRQVLNICLHDAGWDVFSYAYDDIDLSLLKQLCPDLIILNFTKQSGGAGWQFLQMLKMDDTTVHIPILISTTVFPLAVEIRTYLLMHYIQIVYQPFDLETFTRLVRKTLTLANHQGAILSGDRTLPILVVDDGEDLREALETVLMLEGYQVSTASNGLLALEAVYRSDHSLIFLDIQMPIMGGFEFLKIYESQVRPHRPVVVLSAESDLKSKVFPPFVVDVVSKPFDVEYVVGLAEKYTQTV